MTPSFPLYIQEDQAHWLTSDGTVAHGTLGEAADAAGERGVLVLVPAETILLTEISLPPIRQAGRRLNAARYALEEQLAGQVDTLHFALADKAGGRGGMTPVAVIDLDRMRMLMRTLADAGINVTQVAPDVLALPDAAAGEWQVGSIGARVLARTGRDTGFACEQDLWPALAAGAQAEPDRVVIEADNDDAAAALAAAAIPGSPRIERRPVQSTDTAVASLLGHAGERVSFNLCQGEFVRRSDFQRWWQPLKATAALAVICLVLLLATRAVVSYQLHNRIEALHQTTVAAFHDAFPRVRNINNLRLQAKQEIAALRGSGGGAGIYALLQATAEVTSTITGITMKTMQYRDGELILSLEGDSVQVLEALRAGFKRQPQVNMEVERADAAGGGVRIRASVTPA